MGDFEHEYSNDEIVGILRAAFDAQEGRGRIAARRVEEEDQRRAAAEVMRARTLELALIHARACVVVLTVLLWAGLVVGIGLAAGLPWWGWLVNAVAWTGILSIGAEAIRYAEDRFSGVLLADVESVEEIVAGPRH